MMQHGPTVEETEGPHTSDRRRIPMPLGYGVEGRRSSPLGGAGRYQWLAALARARAEYRAAQALTEREKERADERRMLKAREAQQHGDHALPRGVVE